MLDTFIRNLQLATLGNLDRLRGLVAGVLLDVLDSRDNLVALEDLAEDNVAAVEPRGDDGGNEELGAVGVYAS